ncbi:nuclear transport factor 2 family protein [Hymenobacter sp. BT186]|uniref:Nuclear transport factor 2 family protein n=1 Tax=Hymenobacter telluris TaxID=2816474 RepID=A0A939EXB9_9BACT|nr:nuclear transport factor 2 family protein [Hymenobacter telluris]MBO0357623.1 nuclear transport factor 2 family protein [Hymenobacter telluris]MBW3373649.1 nuclear transport factor 2 family protein [Hymenobacter norwichensis]
MKQLLSGFSVLLLLALGSAAAATARPYPVASSAETALTPDEQLFTKLVGEVAAAMEKKNMQALGELMTPGYTHYNPNNGTSHKADETAFIATWPPTTIKLVGPVQVSRSGNMAVTVSQHTYSSTENGQATSRTMQHMIAWTLHNGKWQMDIVQSKEVKA